MEWREKTFLGVMGEVRLNRAYYHCDHCKTGHVPWEQELGILGPHRQTPGAEQIVTLGGVLDAFGETAERTLLKMSGLRLSESTVQRTTEDAGRRLMKLWEEKQLLGGDRVWDWQLDAQGRRCAYVSIDGICVPMQGPGGAKAEGRMAYTAMIYNPDSEYDERRRVPRQVRYLSGFHTLESLGLMLRRQAGQVGWDEADQQIAITDGGSGLEEFMHANFPLAQCILDFYHASEYVASLTRALHPDEDDFKKQNAAWCHQLKHEGGAALLATWEKLDLSGHSAAVRETYRVASQYIRNNLHRTDYPTYLANGWQIGSGPVEAACKTVVAKRLKNSGMRWGADGANPVCHLRALYLSELDQWNEFWHRGRPARYHCAA